MTRLSKDDHTPLIFIPLLLFNDINAIKKKKKLIDNTKK